MSDIEVIFWHEADSGAKGELGIDEKGRLYWNGRPVVTQQKVTLQWWVNLSAIVAAISTVVTAGISVATYFNDTNLSDKYFQSVVKHEKQIESYKNELEELKIKKDEFINYIESQKINSRDSNKILNKTLQPTQKPRG